MESAGVLADQGEHDDRRGGNPPGPGAVLAVGPEEVGAGSLEHHPGPALGVAGRGRPAGPVDAAIDNGGLYGVGGEVAAHAPSPDGRVEVHAPTLGGPDTRPGMATQGLGFPKGNQPDRMYVREPDAEFP